MKSQSGIPSSKVARATRFAGTGAKVGANYLKYYAKKALNPDTDRTELNKANAEDIYKTLSSLKGSALKMAQMLASDKNLLPTEYFEAFRQSQYKAPPLSGPLIAQVFNKTVGKRPQEIFDVFEPEAINAASIGQVHRAWKDGKAFAVKIQYPGVADSIKSDLKLVKPFALRLMNMKEADIKPYFDEVEAKLQEEADYLLEIEQSMALTEACRGIEGMVFPRYYPEWSSEKVIVMDWIEGQALVEWVDGAHDAETRNALGQKMWDFYEYQMHELRWLHADPHPGNFLVTPNNELAVIDFGCTKKVPEDFYHAYFAMLDASNLSDDEVMEKNLQQLDILHAQSGPEEKAFFIDSFRRLSGLLRKPFDTERFDFGDDAYFKEINALGESLGKDPRSRKYGSARGSRHTIYVNRTYFGLFNILNRIGASVLTGEGYAKAVH